MKEEQSPQYRDLASSRPPVTSSLSFNKNFLLNNIYLPMLKDDISNNKVHIKTKKNGCIFENLYVSQFLHQQHFLYNTIHF